MAQIWLSSWDLLKETSLRTANIQKRRVNSTQTSNGNIDCTENSGIGKELKLRPKRRIPQAIPVIWFQLSWWVNLIWFDSIRFDLIWRSSAKEQIIISLMIPLKITLHNFRSVHLIWRSWGPNLLLGNVRNHLYPTKRRLDW